jgi:hypothetical protein
MSAFETNEHREHAEHAAHSGDPMTARISITIAVLAVLAAIAASLETVESSKAIIAANEAVLAQDRATDSWNYYEAKSIKKNLYDVGAAMAGPKAAAFAKKSTIEAAGQAQAQNDAKTQEHVRDVQLKSAEVHETRHHWLTAGAALIEIGIAVSTIAIITKRNLAWLGAMGLGAVGVVVAALAYVV